MAKTRYTDFLSSTSGMLLAAIAANLLWGSAPSCIKLGYRYFDVAGNDVVGQILFAGIRVMVYSFLNPVFGVVLSAVMLNEGKELNVLRCTLALFLVCAGVWLVNYPEKQRLHQLRTRS